MNNLDLIEAYKERAAIMEFEGGLSRDEAEELALKWAREVMENASDRERHTGSIESGKSTVTTDQHREAIAGAHRLLRSES